MCTITIEPMAPAIVRIEAISSRIGQSLPDDAPAERAISPAPASTAVAGDCRNGGITDICNGSETTRCKAAWIRLALRQPKVSARNALSGQHTVEAKPPNSVRLVIGARAS